MDRVVHFEIPAENLERAKTFYSENFGWKRNQFGSEMGNYVLVHTGPTDEQGMPQEVKETSSASSRRRCGNRILFVLAPMIR